MATVRGVVNFHVKSGRYADLFEGLKTLKKIVERLGASMIVNRQTTGSEMGNIIVVLVYADYAAFAKVASDPELSKLIEAMRNDPDPPWDGLTSTLNEEVMI